MANNHAHERNKSLQNTCKTFVYFLYNILIHLFFVVAKSYADQIVLNILKIKKLVFFSCGYTFSSIYSNRPALDICMNLNGLSLFMEASSDE